MGVEPPQQTPKRLSFAPLAAPVLILADATSLKGDKPVPVRTKALFSRLGKDRPVWVRTDMRPYQNGDVHLVLTKTVMRTWALPKRVCDGPYQNGYVHLVLTKTGM